MIRNVLGLGLFTFTALFAAGAERTPLDAGWRFFLGDAPDAGARFAIKEPVDLAKTREADLADARTTAGPPSADPNFGADVSFVRPDFDDRAWRSLDVPHDWAVELPFDPHADINHGFKPVGPGYPQNDIGWYRRALEVPATDRGRYLRLEFDGVYRNSLVWLNGHFLGRNLSGYTSFGYDISPYVNYRGRNEIVVRVDASRFEGWFYEGAGIYRHVWLSQSGPIHLAPGSLFVTTRFASPTLTGPAEIHVAAQMVGVPATAVGMAKLRLAVFAADGTRCGETTASGAPTTLAADLSLPHPRLWSPESPTLYTLVATVVSNGTPVDQTVTKFGIRTFGFDPERGFLLNGRPYVIKGTCNHQDHAGVGTAVPDRVQYYRVARLKEMGANAYRTSHNPPTPELLQACDALGMLVLDETRRMSDDPEALAELKSLVLRDRNHASVAIWSIGNEELAIQSTATGARIARAMQDLVHALDPTRPVTYAANNGAKFDGVNSVIEVHGWNYNLSPDTDIYHRAHPDQPSLGTEQGSTVGTRGEYMTDKARGYVSAYDENDINPTRGGGRTVERWTMIFASRPWLSGAFIWTGFDYRGEPTPCKWPCISSHFGVVDTCGFPKDNFYYYQAWWTNRPVLHLMPHWNWPGRKGQPVEVVCYSNCESVELFVNGKSAGWKPMPRYGHISWTVKYEPGAISAVGWNFGRKIAETRIETTGAPAKIRLSADPAALAAEHCDAVVVDVAILDTVGRVVPTADNLVKFSVRGEGRILGVGNGDPASHEPDKADRRHAFHGYLQVIVQPTQPGAHVELTAVSDGLVAATVMTHSKA